MRKYFNLCTKLTLVVEAFWMLLKRGWQSLYHPWYLEDEIIDMIFFFFVASKTKMEYLFLDFCYLFLFIESKNDEILFDGRDFWLSSMRSWNVFFVFELFLFFRYIWIDRINKYSIIYLPGWDKWEWKWEQNNFVTQK